MKKVLVTGATGFIGRNTITPLIVKGYEVHAVFSHEKRGSDQVFWHHGDLLNPSDVKRIITDVQPTHLLHFAWYTEHERFWRSFDNFKWVEATLALLRTFGKSGGKRAVFAGTCAEYDWKYGYLSEDITPLTPSTPYGICKNALQSLVSSYGDLSGMSVAWGRVFYLYGPYENLLRFVPSVINSLCNMGLAKCSHGNQMRDFMHVKDAAEAFVAILESNVTGPVNVSTGDPVRIKDVAMKIASLLEMAGKVEFGAIEHQPNDPPMIFGNPTRLNQEVGWKPKLSLEQGLANTTNWWLTGVEEVNLNQAGK